MKEFFSDYEDELYTNNWDAICCTINQVLTQDGRLVMGAGVAKILRDFDKQIEYDWGHKLKIQQNKGLVSLLVSNYYEMWHCIGFPTKYHWKNPSDLKLIEKSAKYLRLFCDQMDLQKILLPKPGCSNGGLKWIDVKPVLEPVLDERFFILDRPPQKI